MRRVLVVAGAIWAFGASSASAQRDEPEIEQVTQEVFLGETAYLQERGEIQGTFTTDVRGGDAGLGGGLGLGVEYGLTDELQLGVEMPMGIEPSGQGAVLGAGRPAVEVLAGAAWPGNPEVILSGGVEAAFPSITDDLSENAYGLEPNIRLHLGLLPVRMVLTVAAEIEQSVEAEPTEVGGAASFAVFVPTGSVVPTLEVRGEAGEERRLLGAVGLVASIGEMFQVGASAYGGGGDAGLVYGARALMIAEQDLF